MKKPRLYFDVQHHQSLGNLPWLLTTLSKDAARVTLSFDGPTEVVQDLITESEYLKDNLSLRLTDPVVWCGPSQIKNQITSIKHALQWSDWDYFLNLSGTCIPTKPISELRDFLGKFDTKVPTIFISTFHIKKLTNVKYELSNNPKSERKLGRLLTSTSNEVFSHFSSEEIFPIRNIQNRLFFRSTETIGENKLLEIESLPKSEYKYRKVFAEKNQLRGGKSWFVASRSFCETLIRFLESDLGKEIYEVFFNSFEPDETFLQSLCYQAEIKEKCLIIENNLRYQQGKAIKLNSESLKEAICGPTFFARKWHSIETRNFLTLLEFG